jgi:putative intracellular protease/amidase
MSVLIVLYDGFAEYEYQVPALALHHFRVPFEAVGLGAREVTGMIGLRATTGRTLAEANAEDYEALLLPGVDRTERDRVLGSDIRVDAPAVRDGHVITGLGSRVFHVTALLIAALAGEEPAASYRAWAGIA